MRCKQPKQKQKQQKNTLRIDVIVEYHQLNKRFPLLTTGPVGTRSQPWHTDTFHFILFLLLLVSLTDSLKVGALCFCFCFQKSDSDFWFVLYILFSLALVERFYLEFYGVEPTKNVLALNWSYGGNEHVCSSCEAFFALFRHKTTPC